MYHLVNTVIVSNSVASLCLMLTSSLMPSVNKKA